MPTLEEKIWKKALDFLKIRIHGREELRRKLAEHFPEDPAAVSRTLDEMERVNLINDRQFTEQFTAYLIQKPVGRLKIMVEARRRGLDLKLVEAMLLNLGWDETESARRALAEKERSLREPDPRRRKQKLLNFCRNRGFSDALIYRLLLNS